MAKWQFAYASDTHLRARGGDEFYAFKQIVDRCIKEKVKYLILGGDVFDTQTNRSRAIAFACRQIDRLREADIGVLYIEGQHDRDDPPWLHAHPHATNLHKELVEVGGYTIYGISWQPSIRLQEELAEVPVEADILVTHQVWADWMGDITAPEGDFAQVPGNIRFLLTGDYHKWVRKKYKNADGENMLVISTGATTQQKINEPSEHYFILFGSGDTIEQVTLKSRVFLDAGLFVNNDDLSDFISGFESMLAVAEQKAASMDLPVEMMKPRLYVRYASTLTDCVRRVEKAVNGRAIIVFKEQPPAEKSGAKAISKADTGKAVTPLSVLEEEIDRDEDPAVFELVERLLKTEDGNEEAEFAKWQLEVLEAKIETT